MTNVTQLIFEDGSIGYVSPSERITLQAPDGGDIPVVSERNLGNIPRHQIQQMSADSKFQVGEQHRGSWRLRERTVDELVDRHICSPEEAESRVRRKDHK